MDKKGSNSVDKNNMQVLSPLCRMGFGNGQYDGMRAATEQFLVPEGDESPIEPPLRHRGSSRILKILVIDDILDVAEVLCSLLGHLGHTVTSAHSGIEGIELAQEFQPDVLICDIGMPEMDGYEVAQNFRGNNTLKNVFLIALTGYARPDHMERAAESGFDRQLTKPVDLATLKQTLEEVPKASIP